MNYIVIDQFERNIAGSKIVFNLGDIISDQEVDIEDIKDKLKNMTNQTTAKHTHNLTTTSVDKNNQLIKKKKSSNTP